mgnify:CR=1 FL=1
MTNTAVQAPLLIPKGTPLVPGKMYLRLYHGRTDPAQEMEDWGIVGPTFGPLSCYVHTYCLLLCLPHSRRRRYERGLAGIARQHDPLGRLLLRRYGGIHRQ